MERFDSIADASRSESVAEFAEAERKCFANCRFAFPSCSSKTNRPRGNRARRADGESLSKRLAALF